MVKFSTIQEAMDKGKGKVALRGWVHRERGSSKLKFIVLRDHTNIIQCVIEKEKIGEKKFDIADKIQVETSITITGTIKEDKRAPTGFEINVDKIDRIRGLDVTIVTSATTDEEAFELLKSFGMPFKK